MTRRVRLRNELASNAVLVGDVGVGPHAFASIAAPSGERLVLYLLYWLYWLFLCVFVCGTEWIHAMTH